MRELGTLPNLRKLSLGPNQITDAGMDELAELRESDEVSLFFTPRITDVGVAKLSHLKQLTSLNLTKTRSRMLGCGNWAG